MTRISRILLAAAKAAALALALAAGLVGGQALAANATADAQSQVLPPQGQARADQARAQASSLPEALTRRMLACYVFVGGGSGVLVSSDGLVMTNNHVIDGEADLTLRTSDGAIWPSSLLGTDPVGDIAVLRIDPQAVAAAKKVFTYAEFAPPQALVPGIPVVAVGNPFALGDFDDVPTITAGVLSTARIVRDTYTDAVQADAPVNPGNSGGPLFDLQGRLLGINGQIRSLTGFRINSGIGLAVSSRQLQAFLPLLEHAGGGYVKHTAAPKDLVLELANGGVSVKTAGSSILQAGDRLLQVAGRPVASVPEAVGELAADPSTPIASMQVVILRKGVQTTLSLALGHTPIPGFPYHGLSFIESEGLVIIDHVDAGSPGEAAGVHAGDVVTLVEGGAVTGKISILRARVGKESGARLGLTGRQKDGTTTAVAVLLKQHA